MSLTKRLLDERSKIQMCVCIMKNGDNTCTPCSPDCRYCREMIELSVADEQAEASANSTPDPALTGSTDLF